MFTDSCSIQLSFHSVAPIVLPPIELALVDFDSLIRTDDLLKAALHIVERRLSTELCPSAIVVVPNWCSCCTVWEVARRTMLNVMKTTSMKLRLLCWNHEPCLTEVKAEPAESNVIPRHGHRKPSLWLLSTQQDILNLHFQHNMLLRRSPTCFRKWTPTLVSLKRKARNDLYAEPAAPSVAPLYALAGKIGVALSQRWYEDIREVACSSAIVGRYVDKCVEKRKKRRSTTVGPSHTHKSNYIVVSRIYEKV